MINIYSDNSQIIAFNQSQYQKRLLSKNEKINYAGLLIVCIMWGISFITNSYSIIALLFSTIVLSLLICLNYKAIFKNNNLIVLLFAVASMVLTYIMYQSAGVFFIVLNLILYAFFLNNVTFSTKHTMILHILISIPLYFYVYTCDYSFFSYAHQTKDFFGNTINGNNVGVLALLAFFHFVIFASFIRKKRIKLLLIIGAFVLSIYLIYPTGCRTALISAIVCVLLLFLIKNPIGQKKYNLLLTIELLLCLVFPVIYIFMSGHLENVEIFGKTLFSGRDTIWKSGLELIKKYPIFGCGNSYTYSDSGMDSSHNFMLGVMKMFGIVPTFAVIYSIINNKYGTDRVIQITFISALIIGFFESSFIHLESSPLFMLLLAGCTCNSIKMGNKRFER